ncbi:hypothetical protein V3C40_07175 [Janthinobacterium sp. LS2A]|uniref:hypothetical protein n=1 Tax=Janthinobacterium sp. LS2A TaxID=3118590 RepID=UPI002F947033
MASFKKTVVILFVSATLAFVPIRSQAIVPLIAGWLLEITYGSILISDIVAGMTGSISAILWYECNKFGSINTSVCNNKPPSMPAAQAPKPAITVSLKPDAKRENPDPKKFSDPAPGSGKRDVTPKPIIAASGKGPPSSAQGIPGVPVGPGDIGVLTQAPRESNVGAAGVDPAIQIAQYNGSVARGGPVTGIEVVPQKTPAQPKAIPFIAIHTTCAAKTDCLAPLRATENYLGQFNGYKYINTAAIECCSGTMRYVSIAYLYDQATNVTLVCDPGYVDRGQDISGNYQCGLTDATKVKKPADTTCEVLFDPASKAFMTDKANPACDGLTDTTDLTLTSQDGSQSIEVGANAGDGFDISITKSDGSKTGLDTGVYDPGTGGYVIVHVNITPPEKPDNGLGCGGPGQSACSVEFARDDATSVKSSDTNAANRTADTGMKGKLDAISSSQFNWSFIPSIPTAACKNPSLKSPIGNVTVSMDICVWFDRLSFFINAVLGVLCVYGCVNQIQSAIRD